MKADSLEIEFASRGIASRDGRRFLRATDALALIDRASEEGVPILRVDGAHLPTAADSPPEHLADYSASVARGRGCWADAESVIRARDDRGMAFMLALGDDPIEAV